MEKKDTIAAIASAKSSAGIGIVRISGEDALSVIDKVYRSTSKKKVLSKEPTHTIHYGFIYDGEECVDEVMVLLMLAPNSYTKENTVEIDCHGGMLVTKKVLETVLKAGARIAEPGEFTKRAFLNGRIDLSEAEAVMDVINSESEAALQASMKQLQGSVSKKISEMRDSLIYEIAFIESALDDPEHISLDGYPEKLSKVVNKELANANYLIHTFDNGKIIREGIHVAILGKPNVGKSSLLNKLLGEDKAIVTDIAGTTRDVIEQYVNYNGVGIIFADTAGIRETGDKVEQIGVDLATKKAEEADLILYVIDASKHLEKEDLQIIDILKNKRAIVLLNKNDLDTVVTVSEINELLKDASFEYSVLETSMTEEFGLEDLQDEILHLFHTGQITNNEEVTITNERHKEALTEARDSLLLVQKSIEDNMPEDFFSIDLMNAYTSLGRIIGASVEDDLVREIFTKFCLGK
ncbi:MAG: tRNA uridine-5-carboxymethylaminomethyl(34) synthesis GTPase MnmE [Lachnospiraceae bacterium]|nr:tRNA uridine-5-carboxymethylaminomethyl(34) synthesis GTPase MnmE [Lachnospiraceae bacterium]